MDNTTALAVINEQISALAVTDQDSLTRANTLLVDIKTLRKRFVEEFDPGIKEAFAHHRTLVAQLKKWTDPLDEYERQLKPKIAVYLDEQDRIRFEAQRAAARARLQANKEAEDAADIAFSLVKEGKPEEAKEIVALAHEKIQDIEAETPFVPDKPTANGTTLKTTWDFQVEDASLIPREFLMPDLKAIRAYVSARKDNAKIPGVSIFPVKSVATRIAR